MPAETVKVTKKRKRASPNQVPVQFHMEEMCRDCQSDQVWTDSKEGRVVCRACGLIQQQAVCTAVIASCGFSTANDYTRVLIHHYNRLVHFQTKMRMMTGDSKPQLLPEDETSLRAFCAGCPGGLNPTNLRIALRKCKLSRKYLRHLESLKLRFFPTYTSLHLPADIFFTFSKMFLQVEVHWQRIRKQIDPKRRIFFSYMFLFYQFCFHTGNMHLTGKHHLLKQKEALDRQVANYKEVCKFTHFKFCPCK